MKNSKKEQKPLSVTIAMISYNDEKIIEDCFISIKKQDYLGEIKILIVDGGSTDKTVEIAQKYRALVISKPEYKEAPTKRGDIAVDFIKTDIAMFISADNRLQEKDCLQKMMEPFLDPEISAVETFRYGYRNNDPILSKYFALIGGADPVAISLGKADRAPYDCIKWNSFGKAEENSSYFKVTFDKKTGEIPTLGANGFAIRNKLLQKFKCENSLHIEMCVNLVKSGHNKFAFVKDAHVIHDIDIGLIEFIKRRLKWKNMYSNTNNVKRTYLIYDPKKDKFKLFLLVLLNVTFIFPLLRAIKGFIKKREFAWFLHPIICNIFIISYGLSALNAFIQSRPVPKK